MARAKTLRQIIEAAGLTPSRAAKRAGLSRQVVLNWCRGGVLPWDGKARKLAKVLGVDLDVVMAAVAASRKRTG